MSTKKYWVRLVYSDKPCTELGRQRTQGECWNTIQERFKSDPEVRFAYIMTTDAFGECFLELVRRVAA